MADCGGETSLMGSTLASSYKMVFFLSVNAKSWHRHGSTHTLMNSMVLTSGEVTGLSQDSASKQDAVDGEAQEAGCMTS